MICGDFRAALFGRDLPVNNGVAYVGAFRLFFVVRSPEVKKLFTVRIFLFCNIPFVWLFLCTRWRTYKRVL